jgi:dihydropteroate synthase
MAQRVSPSECWAWVLSPFPLPQPDPQQSFLRLRLSGPGDVLRDAAREFTALGGWASAVAPPSPPTFDHPQIALAGTLGQLNQLAERGPVPAAEAVAAVLATALGGLPPVQLGRYRFDFRRRVYVAGILNNTPDSFYDRGRHFGRHAALARAEEIVEEGADLIEIGGESARAGERLSPAEEIDRVVPLVEILAARYPVPIAVDTYKPDVARAAIGAGAALINDIAGLSEPGMAEVIAASDAGVVVMHLHGRAKEPYRDLNVPSMMDWVGAFLRGRLADAAAAGIPRGRILVDPGLNFGKRPHRDLELMRRLPELRNLGCPIFVATSRKDYIRDLLGLPPDELLEGTAAAVAFAVVQGANMLRVHDVQAMVRVVRMTELLVGHNKTEGAVTPQALSERSESKGEEARDATAQ